MNRHIALIRCFVSIAVFVVFANVASQSMADKPNMIVIMADDLGYGDLSCYGATAFKMPNIDRLALKGDRYRRAEQSIDHLARNIHLGRLYEGGWISDRGDRQMASTLRRQEWPQLEW